MTKYQENGNSTRIGNNFERGEKSEKQPTKRQKKNLERKHGILSYNGTVYAFVLYFWLVTNTIFNGFELL